MSPSTIRRVFRLGVIELGEDYVAYWNRSSSGRIALSPEQVNRWREWFENETYSSVGKRLAGLADEFSLFD